MTFCGTLPPPHNYIAVARGRVEVFHDTDKTHAPLPLRGLKSGNFVFSPLHVRQEASPLISIISRLIISNDA